MSSQPAYRLVDGLGGVADNQLLFATVWADAASYTKGQLLVVNLSGTPGTGYSRCYKKGAADDTDTNGVVIAETITTPTGGGPVQVICGGRIVGSTWGLTAKGDIAIGTRVASSSTAGAIKEATATLAAGTQWFGTCIDAFTNGNADGIVEWNPVPIL